MRTLLALGLLVALAGCETRPVTETTKTTTTTTTSSAPAPATGSRIAR